MKLSKYALMDFISCPRRFKAIHIDKVATKDIWEASVGRQFHEFARDFFSRVPFKKAVRINRLDDLKVLFVSLADAKDEELKVLEYNFCKFEAEHFWKLKTLLPGDFKRYFVPLDVELEVETKTAHFIVDRIDLLTSRQSCVFEYKTSTYWNPTSLRKELAFYAVGLKSIRKYRSLYPPTHIACYNPRLDRFLFEKLSKRSVQSMFTWLERMVDAIKKNNFPRKFSGLCRYCPIADECYSELPPEYQPVRR